MNPETVDELYNKLQDYKEKLEALYNDEEILLNDIKHHNHKLYALQNHIETATESKGSLGVRTIYISNLYYRN